MKKQVKIKKSKKTIIEKHHSGRQGGSPERVARVGRLSSFPKQRVGRRPATQPNPLTHRTQGPKYATRHPRSDIPLQLGQKYI